MMVGHEPQTGPRQDFILYFPPGHLLRYPASFLCNTLNVPLPLPLSADTPPSHYIYITMYNLFEERNFMSFVWLVQQQAESASRIL